MAEVTIERVETKPPLTVGMTWSDGHDRHEITAVGEIAVGVKSKFLGEFSMNPGDVTREIDGTHSIRLTPPDGIPRDFAGPDEAATWYAKNYRNPKKAVEFGMRLERVWRG